MAIKVLKDLICGYTINVFDTPKVVSSMDGRYSMPMRLTHSPIRFMFSLDDCGVAFEDRLSPINIKESPERNAAIEKALIEWAMQHHNIVFGSYQKHVKKPCDGKCENRICLEKTVSPEI